MKELFGSPACLPKVKSKMLYKFEGFNKGYSREDHIRLQQTSWVHPATQVLDSKISGKGIFTTETICENKIMLICGGQLFRNHEIQSGKARLQSLTGFAEGIYLGAPCNAPAGIDEYLNHSCSPNLWLRDEVTLVARRTILKGEELTVDYATWEIDELWQLPSPCNCRFSDCRRVISGKDWMLSSLQSRYHDHFLPCLNLRIKNQKKPKRNNFVEKLVQPFASHLNGIGRRVLRKIQGVEDSLEIIPPETSCRMERLRCLDNQGITSLD